MAWCQRRSSGPEIMRMIRMLLIKVNYLNILYYTTMIVPITADSSASAGYSARTPSREALAWMVQFMILDRING